MRKLFLFLAFSLSTALFAQKDCWIILKDKNQVSYDGNLEHPDFYDLPLREDYIDVVETSVKKVVGQSRWLNAVAVKATSKQLAHLKTLDFVEDIIVCDYKNLRKQSRKETPNSPNENLRSLAQHQTARLGLAHFHELGLTGKGIRIAVFDGGFPGVDTHPAFAHLRPNIVATYDFTKDNAFVWRGNAHGTNVLSNIGGKMDDIPLGLATDAEYLLAITEVNAEPFSEEVSWMLAMEWAYQNGAKIISSSLGYHKDRYFQENMDGQTSLVAKAAIIAARKGMLVVNAAGNEGSGNWKVIITPADADSVLTVGGISPNSEIHIDFSSYGPTFDGRLKPNVSANGLTTVANHRGGFSEVAGTSFSTPLIAGFAACAWQANPDMTNMDMLDAIQRSSELYPYFDYAHGYGVPNAAFFTQKINENQKSFDIEEKDDYIYVIIKDEFSHLLAKSNVYRLFYHIENTDGILSEYAVINVFQKEALRIPKKDSTKSKYLRVHFLGYTETYELK